MCGARPTRAGVDGSPPFWQDGPDAAPAARPTPRRPCGRGGAVGHRRTDRLGAPGSHPIEEQLPP
ncbi:hypothetical protein FM119_13200 [Mycetocola reblochoni REB411]|uniref:Uncharacterized protein n=1 Tax=Mycetocola reblochoni REB411 TaxID=1255698 RepID=A0A1R4KDP2_9MICO|nr:hypothetical protein FM119_13200 [Mycetocola reblochoni REB411]